MAKNKGRKPAPVEGNVDEVMLAVERSPHPESIWTHSVCVDDWNIKNPMRQITGAVRFEEKGDKDTCCYCNKEHKSGLYTREDPRVVHKAEDS